MLLIATSSHKQVALLVDLMYEPAVDAPAEPLLEFLPQKEKMFYTYEDHVVRMDSISDEILDGLEGQFAFEGGALSEHAKYFHSSSHLWDVTTPDHVKAYWGISTVVKKSDRHRKLLRMVPANYAWAEVRGRSHLGMYGGAALTDCYVPGGRWNVASCDQSNAFTSLLTPPWFWCWSAMPPVRAWEIWSLLPPDTQTAASKSSRSDG